MCSKSQLLKSNSHHIYFENFIDIKNEGDKEMLNVKIVLKFYC